MGRPPFVDIGKGLFGLVVAESTEVVGQVVEVVHRAAMEPPHKASSPPQLRFGWERHPGL